MMMTHFSFTYISHVSDCSKIMSNADARIDLEILIDKTNHYYLLCTLIRALKIKLESIKMISFVRPIFSIFYFKLSADVRFAGFQLNSREL